MWELIKALPQDRMIHYLIHPTLNYFQADSAGEGVGVTLVLQVETKGRETGFH